MFVKLSQPLISRKTYFCGPLIWSNEKSSLFLPKPLELASLQSSLSSEISEINSFASAASCFSLRAA